MTETAARTPDQLIEEFLRAPRVAVVGASDRKAKWGYKIFRFLKQRGHEVFAVNPGLDKIEDSPCWKKLEDLPRPDPSRPPVDGIDLVVNPSIGIGVARSAKALGIPIIFAQPGAESAEIADYCRENGIGYVEACVLVEGSNRPIRPSR